MTAKEIKEKAKVQTQFVAYWFTESELQDFCEQLCQEQKEKCYDNFTGLEGANDILNAPMPEL